MLSALYDGLEARVVSDNMSTKQVAHLLYHTSPRERIMLLGHGCDGGLLYTAGGGPLYPSIVNRSHAYQLRRHGSNLVAVWCNADKFAIQCGLHGLFSGMIVSEMDEAEMYGIATTSDELEREMLKMAKRLRQLLDEGVLLSDIPARMLELDDVHSPLTTFNYKNFYYM